MRGGPFTVLGPRSGLRIFFSDLPGYLDGQTARVEVRLVEHRQRGLGLGDGLVPDEGHLARLAVSGAQETAVGHVAVFGEERAKALLGDVLREAFDAEARRGGWGCRGGGGHSGGVDIGSQGERGEEGCNVLRLSRGRSHDNRNEVKTIFRWNRRYRADV